MGGYFKKRFFWMLGAGTGIFVLPFVLFLIGKYDETYHTIGSSPSGMNISIYNGQYSRGFSWWTEDSGETETNLYLSEFVFDEGDLVTAVEVPGDICSAHFDGTILVRGQSQSVSDLTRWGRLFSISYCNHTVALENLLPAQLYYYALGGNGEYIFGQFQTDSDNETVIVNFNDFQTSDGEKLHFGGDTLKAALQCTTEPVDFFAFGGDFTGSFSIENQTYTPIPGWIKSRDSLAEFASGIPMVMAPGNHDAAGNLFTANNMVSYGGISDNGGYYSFDYNNIHFAVLNSNEFDAEQYMWIQKDLAQANAREEIAWIILMLHKGPYTTGDHGFSMENEYIETIGQLASQYHVDLVLQAHDHTFSKTYPYRWDSAGYTEKEMDDLVINQSSGRILYNGTEYDCDPQGTYYVSCGASGHRLGENTEFALPYGEKSYLNRRCKVAVSEIRLDSKYASAGMAASMDLGKCMFGLIKIQGNRMVYEFYAAENGSPVLFDRLAVFKSR